MVLQDWTGFPFYWLDSPPLGTLQFAMLHPHSPLWLPGGPQDEKFISVLLLYYFWKTNIVKSIQFLKLVLFWTYFSTQTSTIFQASEGPVGADWVAKDYCRNPAKPSIKSVPPDAGHNPSVIFFEPLLCCTAPFSTAFCGPLVPRHAPAQRALLHHQRSHKMIACVILRRDTSILSCSPVPLAIALHP
jgi:hypothetical protein